MIFKKKKKKYIKFYIVIQRIGEFAIVIEDEESPLPAFGFV